MRRYNGRLFRIARAILKDDAEAEDALQDAYIRAYRHIGDFRGDAQLGTWLTRIIDQPGADAAAQTEARPRGRSLRQRSRRPAATMEADVADATIGIAVQRHAARRDSPDCSSAGSTSCPSRSAPCS